MLQHYKTTQILTRRNRRHTYTTNV